MNYNTAKCFLLAVVLTFIRGRGLHSTHKPDVTGGEPKECLINYYFNGKVCTDCPVGYFGDRCSLSCPPPTYGDDCAEHCTCVHVSCHHVYGCSETAECPAGYFGDNCSSSCPPPTYGDACAEHCSCSHASCHHVYGCNITKAIRTEEEGNKLKSKHIRISIIASGILISTCLLLLITRKMYKLWCEPALGDNSQNPSDTPDVDNIYTDIMESSPNFFLN